MKKLAVCCFFLFCAFPARAQYTRQDTLRGSNGRGRDWWDVLSYSLMIEFDTARGIIAGYNIVNFRVTDESRDSMQIDLQDGMSIRDMKQIDKDGKPLAFTRDGNVCWVKKPPGAWEKGRNYKIMVRFKGRPRTAVNPPWDGGFIWSRDSLGKPWIAVACQFLGASSWWPCKDYQGDEPDSGMSVSYSIGTTLPGEKGNLDCIGNGRRSEYVMEDPIDGSKYVAYSVRNPINTYNTTFYIGDYAHWRDTLRGEKGVLDLDFYPLKYHEPQARNHWAVTKDMLRCFEHWFGPYPFYEDGYKLVEAPYLGMEHQGAIAYGNGYKMGYRGSDLSKTGVGLSYDYIIIHESAHEWFGNNITARDQAENWLHESFATYGEVLFIEWIRGKDSAFRYTRDLWGNLRFDGTHVIGNYGVNYKANSNIYYKGAAILHMIRIMLHDDEKFRQLMRGLNRDFYHKIVSSKDVEAYFSRVSGMNLAPFFNQYLRQAGVPIVHAKQTGEYIKLDMLAYDEALKLPVYDQNGKFVCELSRMPVSIPVKDLPALLNYLIVYVPETGTTELPPN